VRPPLLTQSAIERIVRQTWVEELDEDVAHNTANFFELGGTSLSAIRVAARLGRSLGIHLPAHVIFENMTVRSLSSEILARVERNEFDRSESPQ
jgi:acyl carrier protein